MEVQNITLAAFNAILIATTNQAILINNSSSKYGVIVSVGRDDDNMIHLFQRQIAYVNNTSISVKQSDLIYAWYSSSKFQTSLDHSWNPAGDLTPTNIYKIM